ncbi:MAG: RluA family pseudouridine synthase [Lachnospiraceae bacterium]|nr:RluA family pseudouridine synthase [Lachnospiraceae bacterium]
MEEEKVYYLENDQTGVRLDKLLSDLDPDLTRSHAEQLIEAGKVSVNDMECRKGSYKGKEGDLIRVLIPEPEETEILPEKMDVPILYEDDDIIIVNKPKGMVVHPAPGHNTGTLVNGLLYHCKDSLSGINGNLRPGIVHRIDRDTTGVLVACKNDKAHLSLSKQLSEHSITRIYYCIVQGNVTEDGTVDAPIGRSPKDRKKMAIVQGGRRAVTHYHVIEHLKGGYTFLSCQLETGRTHQIRVHMSSLGHPLVGDTVYGSSKQPLTGEGQVLHAGVLGFIHPGTGEYVEFSAELPEYFRDLLEKLRR